MSGGHLLGIILPVLSSKRHPISSQDMPLGSSATTEKEVVELVAEATRMFAEIQKQEQVLSMFSKSMKVIKQRPDAAS